MLRPDSLLRAQARAAAALLFACLVACLLPSLAAAEEFPMPSGPGWTTWPATEAAQLGRWAASVPEQAGRYVQPAAAGDELRFPFTAAHAATLRVRPLWWRNGEQKLAHRFPFPLTRQPGPDTLDYVGSTVFATAPASGRVIAVDAVAERPLGYVDVGGYLADLVADRDGGRVYVADALGDRIVVIDARARAIASIVSLPGGPWSLALHQGILYVACRESHTLSALSAATGQVIRQIHLPASPISVALTGTPPDALLVRFQQQTYDVFTLAPATADEQQFLSEPTGNLEVEASRDGGDTRATNVSALMTGDTIAGAAQFGGISGPSAAVDKREGKERLVYFLLPNRGRIGIAHPRTREVEAIDVGVYLSGLASYQDALYAADPAHDRILIIDPKTGRTTGELKVTGQPYSLAVVATIAWQRRAGIGPGPFPETPVNRLYVLCRQSHELAVVDLTTRAIVKRVPLPAEPRRVSAISVPCAEWWHLTADERMPIHLQPRIAVGLRPLTLSLDCSRTSPAPLDTPEWAPRRSRVTVPAGAAAKEFSAANNLLLDIDGRRHLDLTATADPQLLPDPPLAAKELDAGGPAAARYMAPSATGPAGPETTGSITVSLDDGPEMNWAAGVRQAPDTEMFLVGETDEFWRYNAPAFSVTPGEHVLRIKAYSPYVRLRGVAVRQNLDLEVTAQPEPAAVHRQVPLPFYQGVFHDQEPVRFTLRFRSRAGAATSATVSYRLQNYLGETCPAPGPTSFRIEAGATASRTIELTPADTGRFALTITVGTPQSEMTKGVYFVRLPKLEHPRLFFRRSDLPAIRARIARYPNLFRRYADWLERMVPKEGSYPERFLPPGLTREELSAVASDDMKPGGFLEREYELGWRIVATEFAAEVLRPGSPVLKASADRLMRAADTTGYIQFHHHGPFFPGAEVAPVDVAPERVRELLPMYRMMRDNLGTMDEPAWTLETLEEPLTPEKRALVYQLMNYENNAIQYFETHMGTRAGTWWQGPYSGCHCPMQGYTAFLVFMHNFFGEPRLFEKPVFGQFLTFLRHTDPYLPDEGPWSRMAGGTQVDRDPDRDPVVIQANRRRPNGEPWHWILSALTHNPLEKTAYRWDEWVKQMEGPMPGDERAAVDELMVPEKLPMVGPLCGETNYFVSGISVPIALALGWYEPASPAVSYEELPPTNVFDSEGWVVMHSGWDKDLTEVTFVSGLRDHTIRHKPNHFTILKSGQYLIGTPSLQYDDGNPTAAWGNCITVNDEWREQWQYNLQQPRDGEYAIIDRFSPLTWTYLTRDQELSPYQAPGGGWGGNLCLHGHTETMFMQEGKLLAYETWTELDYAAGDAANAWPVDQVSQMDRQLVFLKPDLVVLYDRVKLGPAGHTSRWVAAAASQVSTSDRDFLIHSGRAALSGRVLLPEQPIFEMPKTEDIGWLWKGQKDLEIRPTSQTSDTEYLVVMRTGEGEVRVPQMQLIHDEKNAGLRMDLDGKQITVRFRRAGRVGGEAVVTTAGTATRYQLQEGIQDSLRHWRSDSHYEAWTTEPRFSFVIPPGDRKSVQ